MFLLPAAAPCRPFYLKTVYLSSKYLKLFYAFPDYCSLILLHQIITFSMQDFLFWFSSLMIFYQVVYFFNRWRKFFASINGICNILQIRLSFGPLFQTFFLFSQIIFENLIFLR
ncbi:hypothetical protein PUN28_013803 [Cardiocondyla obscurior]|uniref:Uncharacterized protein n=1 Tax=Cardiocondyla obscurior TaxID=286306 RepID=A0AAW2F922_9HYME